MKKVKLVAVLMVTILVIVSCRDNNNPVDTEKTYTSVGFSDERVGKILETNCTTSGCHAGSNPANGLSLESHGNLMLGSSSRAYKETTNGGGAVVIPFRPEESLLYRMISGQTTPSMPMGRGILASGDIEIIKTWIENGARDENDVVPLPGEGYTVYACSQNADRINVVDGDLNNVIRIINTDFISENDAPHMVKYSDGYIYATTIKSGKLLKIRSDDFTIVTATEGLEYPGMIQINTSGTKAYVSRSSTAPGSYSSIYEINLADMKLIREIVLPVEGIPHGIALSHDDKTLYVANLTKNRISIVDAETGDLKNDISLSGSVDHQPMQTAISPDDKYLYISARGTGKLLVMDTGSLEIISEVAVGPGPMHLAIKSDGSKIYVPTMMNGKVNVVTFDGSEWTKTGEISHPAFMMPHGCDITPDDKFLYVSFRNTEGMYQPHYPNPLNPAPGLLAVIDLRNETVLKYTEIGAYGSGLTVKK